jgi:hypothetical protein
MRRVRCMCGFASPAEMLERLFFKNSEVVLTHQIQRNLYGSERKFGDKEFIESCRIRESATYNSRLIGVIWSSE